MDILIKIMNQIIIKLAICLFLLFSADHCFASDSLTVRYLGIEQGLSNNAVTCIYQDHNGFLWFGTYDGLNKYDGYSFNIFKNVIGDSTSIQDNHIFCIGSDFQNNIWVGNSRGFSIYNPVKSIFLTPHFKKINSSKIYSINSQALAIQAVEGNILAGTAGNGLIVFNRDSLTGQQIPLQDSNDINYNVPCIAYDSLHHNTWLFIVGKGLYQYEMEMKKLILVASNIKQCNHLFIRSDGNPFVCNNNGVFMLNGNNLIPFDLIPNMSVRNMLEDKKHGIQIASDGNGLWYLPPDGGKAYPYIINGKTFNSNSIYDLYVDATGREWIGTLRGGINIIEPNNNLFTTVSFNKNINQDGANDFILSFCEDDNSNLWIGTDGAGLRYWNKHNNTFTEYTQTSSPNSLSSNFITYIMRDSRKNIWFSTWFGGINKFVAKTHTFKKYKCYNPIKKSEDNDIWDMYEDKHKNLWAAASNEGALYLYNNISDQFELFDTALINLQTIVEDSSGNLWGGTYTSLILIDPINKKHKIYNIGYPVRSIHEDKFHSFWVGTEGGGLLAFNRKTGKYLRLTTKDGLPNNTILRILEDKHGDLWLSTYYGISRFSPETKTFKNFTRYDGLQSNQFSFNAATITSNGEFLFGGIKGFNSFYPDSIYDKKDILNIFLTGLKINNIPIENSINYISEYNKDIVTGITIPYNKAMLVIDYTALDYSNADILKYAYFLKGYDKGWNAANKNRTVNFSHLKEGKYAFYVKVMDADGAWSGETRLLSIIVLPPWYRTWWAYLLYLMTASSFFYIFLLYYKRQERLRYEVKLAFVEKQKEKELTERKIEFFTHISHEFRTPLTLIVNPLKELLTESTSEKINKKILIIQRNAKRLLSLVDQLLLFRKVDSIDHQLRIEHFDIKEACQEVFLSFTQLASSKHIEFTFQHPEGDIIYNGDKEKIEIILFNLISNALKYTPENGKVEMSINEYSENISITVSDTGCGITAHTNDKLFESFYRANNSREAFQTGFGVGLYVSQKLTIAHSGKLSYVSEEGNGSVFTLTLPKNYFADYDPVKKAVKRDNSSILQELVEDIQEEEAHKENNVNDNKSYVIDRVISGLPNMVIVDDDAGLRNYIKDIFIDSFNIYEAEDGIPAYDIINKEMPDIVISDVIMKRMDGIELCRRLKEDIKLAHIPVILLTGGASEQSKLKGIECGAEDYINKPFDNDLIVARVQNILKSRKRLQHYFFNTVTLQPVSSIDADQKEFLERCIQIIEAHLDDSDFTIQLFCREIGMSHPTLYKKIRAISGLTVNVFIRYLRLRKAAELLINTNKTITEVTYITGFNDMKYFREQFSKLFGMNPSEYIKRYRKTFGNKIFNKGN